MVEAGPEGPGQGGQLGGRCELPVQAVPYLVDAVARLVRQDGGERVAVHVVASGHDREATALAGVGRRYRASVPSFWRIVDADSARPRAAAGRRTRPASAHPEFHHRDVQGGALRAAVFGVSDGLVSNMGLILGVAGADPQPAVVRLAGLAGLIVIPTFAGQLLLFRVLRLHGSRKLSIVTYLMPAFAVAYGAVLLDEPVTGAMIAGFALIVTGAVLASGQRLFGVRAQESAA